MKIGLNGLNLIKHFESCRLEAFKPIPTDPWTIGWGHTKDVKEGDTCTQEQADEWLLADTWDASQAVTSGCRVPLGRNQFDALVSFTYNCGIAAFNISTLRKLLNAGDYAGAANEFPRWNKSAGKELAGLTRRRAAEKRLFETPDESDFDP